MMGVRAVSCPPPSTLAPDTVHSPENLNRAILVHLLEEALHKRLGAKNHLHPVGYTLTLTLSYRGRGKLLRPQEFPPPLVGGGEREGESE
jgi:hypothetical protein